MAINPTAQKIMDIAERAARTGGYDGFSFREIAAELGIKPASVHYHFPTKAALGTAIVAHYTDRFLAALGDADAPAPVLLDRYIAAYRHSVAEENLMCLCGMFGAEIAKLPPPVADTARAFFDRNIDWIAPVLDRLGATDPRAEAKALIAALEGGLVVARATGDLGAFDAAAAMATRGIASGAATA